MRPRRDRDSRDGTPRDHRVVFAMDGGPNINPDTIEAPMQGGIVFRFTAAHAVVNTTFAATSMCFRTLPFGSPVKG